MKIHEASCFDSMTWRHLQSHFGRCMNPWLSWFECVYRVLKALVPLAEQARFCGFSLRCDPPCKCSRRGNQNSSFCVRKKGSVGGGAGGRKKLDHGEYFEYWKTCWFSLKFVQDTHKNSTCVCKSTNPPEFICWIRSSGQWCPAGVDKSLGEGSFRDIAFRNVFQKCR